MSGLASNFGDLVHMDIWGLATICSMDCAHFILTIVNDAMHWMHTVLMQYKSNAFAKFVIWQSMLKTQYSITIKCIQSDNDPVFLSNEFKSFLQSQGMIQCFTVHDTPAQNGVVKWAHC